MLNFEGLCGMSKYIDVYRDNLQWKKLGRVVRAGSKGTKQLKVMVECRRQTSLVEECVD